MSVTYQYCWDAGITMANVGISNSWTLVDFARIYGTMKLANFTNADTGETFKSCAFVNNGAVTLVGFSSALGELSADQIKDQKNSLQVVKLESGNYKLCKTGDSTWETVDLGL